MCRLAAYLGPEIPLENIIAKPCHSLLVQSQDAQEAKLRVNGDGFGIAWYGHLPEPGLFRDVCPAWSDSNLPSICRLVRARLFLAHVRAATSGSNARENCHPFGYRQWSFMHNGGLGDFDKMRRAMEAEIADQHYLSRRGTTDSELLFLLLLSNGLETEPAAALDKTLNQVHRLWRENGADGQPLRITCVLSDGKRLFGFRHASDGKAPTLYVADGLDHGGRAFASEPLEGAAPRWCKVPADTLVLLTEGAAEERPLRAGNAVISTLDRQVG